MKQRRKQKGFTIIELVVVILLLGILTATVLPRFMNISDDAHRSVVRAVQGSLNSGLLLYKSQWIAEGQKAGSSPTDYPLVSTEYGTPGIIDHASCVDVYEGLLSGAGGQPVVVAGVSDDVPAANVSEVSAPAPAPNPYDFVAAAVDDNCYFIYTAFERGTNALSDNFHLIYDPDTGGVEFVEPVL